MIQWHLGLEINVLYSDPARSSLHTSLGSTFRTVVEPCSHQLNYLSLVCLHSSLWSSFQSILPECPSVSPSGSDHVTGTSPFFLIQTMRRMCSSSVGIGLLADIRNWCQVALDTVHFHLWLWGTGRLFPQTPAHAWIFPAWSHWEMPILPCRTVRAGMESLESLLWESFLLGESSP